MLSLKNKVKRLANKSHYPFVAKLLSRAVQAEDSLA
jgi:hypothetical protein